MSSRSRWTILAFSLLGLAFSCAAAHVHYRLLTEPGYVSPCDINAHFNCSEVYLSRFGSVWGVPVALGGVIFFAMITLLTLFGVPGATRSDDATASYVFAGSVVGLAVVLYFAWVSVAVLKTGCILCMGTYVGVIGLVISSAATATVPISTLPGRFGRDVRTLARDPLRLLMLLILIVAAVILIRHFPKKSATGAASTVAAPAAPAGTAGEQQFDAIWAQQPRIDLGVPADGAKVVIVKFNDWQCPSCKEAYYAYKPVLDEYERTMPGVIKYVTRDYPLNSKCNFSVTVLPHPAACEAAVAVRLANEQGKGDAMITWLFANQEELTPQTVAARVQSQLGVADFAGAYARIMPAMKQDFADGGALHIDHTPWYYINGVLADNGSWLQRPYLDYAIRYELAHPRTNIPAASR